MHPKTIKGTTVQECSEQVGCQWFMHVIPATWEAENERIIVQGQRGQIVLETLAPK
jgi:hypothetical protein